MRAWRRLSGRGNEGIRISHSSKSGGACSALALVFIFGTFFSLFRILIGLHFEKTRHFVNM